MRRLSLLLALVILCSGAGGVEAPREPNESPIFAHSQQRVEDAIINAADRICNVIKIASTTESVKGTDEIKTELRGLIKQLTDLGINVQGQYSTESYAGVLQADLPSTLKDSVDCKLQVLDKLVDRMLRDEPQEAGNLVIVKCDRLASHPSDKTRPVGIPGVDFAHIDSAQAVSACQDALRVRPNDMRIVFQLGRSLQKDGSSSAMIEAARLYKLAADQGYAAAQYNLGVFYESGRGGLAKNDQEAARLFKLAADQGYAAAQNNLGRFHESGRGGLAKSDQEATRLYKLAADQGLAAAQYNLGRFYEKGRGGLVQNDQEAARLYKLAADQGYAAAQNNLGRFHESGRGGLAKNDQEAARLYKLAADQGYAAAQTNLGVLNESGRGGLAKDGQEAARLYKLAADQGFAAAQYNLGRFYESGSGRGELGKDDYEATRLYKLAADQGLAAAQYNLGRFYEKGRGGLAQNDQEAARLYKLAADQGLAGAQYNLGHFFESGRGGLARDNQEAIRLYDLAARQGYATADEPMRIEVVRSSQPGCEPKCAEWISAEGGIVLATAEQLRKVVNSLGGRKLPILIHSGGGVVHQAMLMGFLIRARGLDVAVARTVFDPCANAPGGCKQGTWSGPVGEPDSQSAFCSPACTFVLAGGVRRFVGPDARVGVHNFMLNPAMVERWRKTYRGTVPVDTVIQRSFVPPIVVENRTYFRKLGISEEIVDLMISTPASDTRILTGTELLRLRLATEVKDARAVVYP